MAVAMPPGLTAELLEKILKSSEEEETISIVKIAVKAATQTGDNYASDIYRINVEYTRNSRNQEIKRKKSLIVKVALTSEGKQKEMMDDEGIFNTEISMMTSTLQEMQMHLDDVTLSAKCFYAHDEDPQFLVVEDLSQLGYRMADRQIGLDLQHCLLAMRGLAKFHASSVAVCEKHPEYKSKYNKGMCYLNATSGLVNVITSGVSNLAETVATWPGIGEICGHKLIKLSKVIYEKIALLKQPDETEFNVINHGDCWANNMLFQYNEQNQPVAHIFVDFQCPTYASPAIDLHYFLNAGPSEEVAINHTDKLINEYHQTLCETMKKINCRTPPPTLADLKKSMEKLELYGVLTACLTLPFVLQKKEKAVKKEDILDENGRFNTTESYRTPEFINAISRRLLHWNEIGLLDNY